MTITTATRFPNEVTRSADMKQETQRDDKPVLSRVGHRMGHLRAYTRQRLRTKARDERVTNIRHGPSRSPENKASAAGAEPRFRFWESGFLCAQALLSRLAGDNCAAAVGRADRQARAREPGRRCLCARALGRACARVVRELGTGSRGEGVGLNPGLAHAGAIQSIWRVFPGFSSLIPSLRCSVVAFRKLAVLPRRTTSEDFCSLPSGVWGLQKKKENVFLRD